MLKLSIPTDAFWVDCPHGVRLLCRPMTTALQNAAVARAARRIKDATAAVDADPDILAGEMQAESLVALGEVLIEAWDGVGNAEGTAAAPVTPDNVRALLALPEVALAFNRGISQPLATMAAEGNA